MSDQEMRSHELRYYAIARYLDSGAIAKRSTTCDAKYQSLAVSKYEKFV
ncbi:MAG: hypothetical protein AAGA80_14300 [Cyanobacteria bacterium P01_F01_bin.143]